MYIIYKCIIECEALTIDLPKSPKLLPKFPLTTGAPKVLLYKGLSEPPEGAARHREARHIHNYINN